MIVYGFSGLSAIGIKVRKGKTHSLGAGNQLVCHRPPETAAAAACVDRSHDQRTALRRFCM